MSDPIINNVSLHSSVSRKCSASNRILSAKDHASVQINVAEVDESTGFHDNGSQSHQQHLYNSHQVA